MRLASNSIQPICGLQLDQICRSVGQTFPAIAAARMDALKTEDRIRKSIADIRIAPDIGLVAFGSLARLEWTSGSDVDWTLLVDGKA